MAQQISIPVNCFKAGDDTPCSILSHNCILWEGPGETPSGFKCLCYLIIAF